MSRSDFYLSRWPLLLVAAAIVLSSSGCVGLAAQILYMWDGLKVKAEYNGLKDKKVAVVVVSKASAYGNGAEAETIARLVSTHLQKEVKKIEIIPHSEVRNWVDNNDWDYFDYRAVGKGVGAEMLVAIDLNSISYYEGQTLYKGRCSYKVSVLDMEKGGLCVFPKSEEFQYPIHGGRPATDMSEAAFRKLYVQMIAENIAQSFYDYEAVKQYGSDARDTGE